jgi:predicted RNA-binding Zn-ribbon protein involved in translation (DUF1610 family)
VTTKELWECPDCGRRFANANQWHPCGRWIVENHLDGKPATIVEMYHRIVEMARSCGDVAVEPTKKMIEFKAPTSFAAVAIRDRWIDLHLMLPNMQNTPRVLKQLKVSPEILEHTIRLKKISKLDEEIQMWLCEAYEAAQSRSRREH